MQYTHVRHPRSSPPLKASVGEAPALEITSSIAVFSFAESKPAFILPRQLKGSQRDFSSNTFFMSSLYEAIHASTSISSRPSIIAISLSCQSCFVITNSASTYPPVLVPLMRSKTSHGFTLGRPAFWRS